MWEQAVRRNWRQSIQEENIKSFTEKYGKESKMTLEIDTKYSAGFAPGLIRTGNKIAHWLKLEKSGFLGRGCVETANEQLSFSHSLGTLF